MLFVYQFMIFSNKRQNQMFLVLLLKRSHSDLPYQERYLSFHTYFVNSRHHIAQLLYYNTNQIYFKYSLTPNHQQMTTAVSHNKNTKKERIGRWSNAESNLFEELMQRYGKNWKKIHEHMRGRTLSQIRSHAQKFFDRIGHKKALEYEHRAKLIEALETFEQEKRLQERQKDGSIEQRLEERQIKKQEEENQPLIINQEATFTSPDIPLKDTKLSENFKIQTAVVQEKRGDSEVFGSNYYQMPFVSDQHGFLINLIYINPGAFAQYGLNLQQWGNSQVFYPQCIQGESQDE